MPLEKNKSTKKSRSFWEFVEQTARAVALWPVWKYGGNENKELKEITHILSSINLKKNDFPKFRKISYNKSGHIVVTIEAGGSYRDIYKEELENLYNNKYFVFEKNHEAEIKFIYLYFDPNVPNDKWMKKFIENPHREKLL